MFEQLYRHCVNREIYLSICAVNYYVLATSTCLNLRDIWSLSFEISCQKSSANSILYQRQSANSVFHVAFLRFYRAFISRFTTITYGVRPRLFNPGRILVLGHSEAEILDVEHEYRHSAKCGP